MGAAAGVSFEVGGVGEESDMVINGVGRSVVVVDNCLLLTVVVVGRKDEESVVTGVVVVEKCEELR